MTHPNATGNTRSVNGQPISNDRPQRIRLDHLDPMHCGTVIQVDADQQAYSQLMAMGVCVGRRVQLIQGGDPLILRVLGSRIGLSARLAAGVWVQACQAAQPSGARP